MEDALALATGIYLERKFQVCLNPCCNGRCTRTGTKKSSIYKDELS